MCEFFVAFCGITVIIDSQRSVIPNNNVYIDKYVRKVSIFDIGDINIGIDIIAQNIVIKIWLKFINSLLAISIIIIIICDNPIIIIYNENNKGKKPVINLGNNDNNMQTIKLNMYEIKFFVCSFFDNFL